MSEYVCVSVLFCDILSQQIRVLDIGYGIHVHVSNCIQDHGHTPGLEASEQKRRLLEQSLRGAVAAEDFVNAAALKTSLQILLEA